MTEQPDPAIPEFNLGDRMLIALRHSGFRVADMADYLGVSRQSVGNWINNRVEPGTQTLRLWALRTGVPYEWLAGDCLRPRGRPSGVPVSSPAVFNLQSSTRSDLRMAA